MKHSEEYIENRLKWRGKKNGLPKKNSHFFDDLSQDEKQEFNNTIDSTGIGKPVLVFKGKKKRWTIFGTKMIASGSHLLFNTIEYLKIDEHTIGDDPLGVFSEKEPSRLTMFRLRKFKQHQILVKEKGGRMITLYGPKGEEIYDMYNIMLMLQRMSKTLD